MVRVWAECEVSVCVRVECVTCGRAALELTHNACVRVCRQHCFASGDCPARRETGTFVCGLSTKSRQKPTTVACRINQRTARMLRLPGSVSLLFSVVRLRRCRHVLSTHDTRWCWHHKASLLLLLLLRCVLLVVWAPNQLPHKPGRVAAVERSGRHESEQCQQNPVR